MKIKSVLCTILTLLAVLSLASCGNKTLSDTLNCDEILEAALESQDNPPEGLEIYKKSDGSLDSYKLSLFAYGKFEECADFELIDDCVFYTCGGTQSFEIDIIKAKDADSAIKSDELLAARLNTISEGDRAAYDPNFESMISSAVHFTSGRFAVLLITFDTPSAKDAILNL